MERQPYYNPENFKPNFVMEIGENLSIIKYNVNPNEGSKERLVDIKNAERIVCFISKMSSGQKNLLYNIGDLNPALVTNYKTMPKSKNFNSISIDCKFFGTLGQNCISLFLTNEPFGFIQLANISKQIINYLYEAERRNFLHESIEIEQIVYYNGGIKIVPHIERIRDNYVFQMNKDNYIFPSNKRFITRQTEGEAPELFNIKSMTNEGQIEMPNLLVVYSFGIIVLKLFNILEGNVTEFLKVNKKNSSTNNQNIQILSERIFEKYSNSYNNQKLRLFCDQIKYCLDFFPEKRANLKRIKEEFDKIIDAKMDSVSPKKRTYQKSSYLNFSTGSLNSRPQTNPSPSKKPIFSKEVMQIISSIQQNFRNQDYQLSKVLNPILELDMNIFYSYYSHERNWNFLYKKIKREEMDILHFIGTSTQNQLNSIKIYETIFQGREKTTGEDENQKNFRSNQSQYFKLLCDIIKKSVGLNQLKLDTLIVPGNNLKELQLSIINCTGLKDLSLNYCVITDEGLINILKSVKLKNLKELNLFCSGLTNPSINFLFDYLKNINLTTLNIG